MEGERRDKPATYVVDYWASPLGEVGRGVRPRPLLRMRIWQCGFGNERDE